MKKWWLVALLAVTVLVPWRRAYADTCAILSEWLQLDQPTVTVDGLPPAPDAALPPGVLAKMCLRADFSAVKLYDCDKGKWSGTVFGGPK